MLFRRVCFDETHVFGLFSGGAVSMAVMAMHAAMAMQIGHVYNANRIFSCAATTNRRNAGMESPA